MSETSERHVWRLDDGETHLIASATEEGARTAGREEYAVGEDDEPVECRMLPDDELLTAGSPDENDIEDINDLPPTAVVRARDGHKPPAVTMTCAEWARYVGEGHYIGGSIY